MKKEKSPPQKDDVWTFEHAEFMDDAIDSAKEDLLLTHDIENDDNEKEFIERLDTILTTFDVKLSDVIVRGIRAKNAPARGGRVAKKEPSFALLVQYAWERSERKTCLSMWKFLIRELTTSDIGGRNIIEGYDFVYEKKTNKVTLYFEDERKRPKEMGFRSFQRRVAILRETKKYIATK